MTIVVGVAAPDGLVLAADSRTTRVVDQRYRISSDAAHKVFALCGRFGVATYGAAFIGTNTIAGEMDEFVAELTTGGVPDDVEHLAEALGSFFQTRAVSAGMEPTDGAQL